MLEYQRVTPFLESTLYCFSDNLRTFLFPQRYVKRRHGLMIYSAQIMRAHSNGNLIGSDSIQGA